MKTFDQLYAELKVRAASGDADSETVKWLGLGVHSIGKKVVEEAAEVFAAAEFESKDRLADEISQLLYHIQVLMLSKGLELSDIEERL